MFKVSIDFNNIWEKLLKTFGLIFLNDYDNYKILGNEIKEIYRKKASFSNFEYDQIKIIKQSEISLNEPKISCKIIFLIIL